MRVDVMCGGKGTRLGEPIKCLTEVAGRVWMDWKIDQLRGAGATTIVLWCGHDTDTFMEQYQHRPGIHYRGDDRKGIEPILRTPGIGWWTHGDVLLAQPLSDITEPTMYVRRDPEHSNIAGVYLDCGLYYGTSHWACTETAATPIHINTPEDRKVADATLRRYGLFG
jgi:hypothetical protein